MPDLPILALPLLVTWPNRGSGGGTGFFVRGVDETFLVTAAHVPHGRPPRTDWAHWSPTLTVALGAQPTVALFDDGPFGPSPRFHFMRSSTDTAALVDAIAVRCHPHDLGLDNVRVHSLYAPGPTAGSEATLHGYPVNGCSWPTLASLTGSVLRSDESFLVADLGATEGFSGGPVLGPEGQLRGMVCGTGRTGLSDDEDRIVPPGLIQALVLVSDGHLPPTSQFPMFPTGPFSLNN